MHWRKRYHKLVDLNFNLKYITCRLERRDENKSVFQIIIVLYSNISPILLEAKGFLNPVPILLKDISFIVGNQVVAGP